MCAKFRVPFLPAVLGVAIACCASAFGLSPPLETDDPETPGKGGWEINITSSIEKTRDATAMEVPLLDINYGFRENDQFKIEFALESVDARVDKNHWGISDLLIGYKYRFLDEDKEPGWAVSFYPQVATPTGNRNVGIGGGDTELQIPFQFGKHFYDKRLYINPEVGYNVVFDDSTLNHWKFGLAAEWRTTERLEVMGEVGAFIFPQDGEPDDPFFNFGFEYIINKHVALLGSAGRSFRDRQDGTPEFMALFGFEFTFGGRGEENESGSSSNEGEKESTARARSRDSRMARSSGGWIR